MSFPTATKVRLTKVGPNAEFTRIDIVLSDKDGKTINLLGGTMDPEQNLALSRALIVDGDAEIEIGTNYTVAEGAAA